MTPWLSSNIGSVLNQYEAALFIVHILSGINAWEHVHALPFDGTILRGKRGHRLGISLFYFAARYFSFVATSSMAIYLVVVDYKRIEAFLYVFQICYPLSRASAYQIICLSVMSTWQHPVITSFLSLLQAGVWSLEIASLALLSELNTDDFFQLFLDIYMAVTTCIIFALTLLAIYYPHKYLAQDPTSLAGADDITRQKKAKWRRMLCISVAEIAIIWSTRTVASVVDIVIAEGSGYPKLFAGYLAYVPLTMCACRIYKRRLVRCDTCSLYERLRKILSSARQALLHSVSGGLGDPQGRTLPLRATHVQASSFASVADGRDGDIELRVLADSCNPNGRLYSSLVNTASLARPSPSTDLLPQAS